MILFIPLGNSMPIIIPPFTTRLTEVTRDLQHHHHHHHHSHQQDNDQPLDMSKPNQPRGERGPPTTSDTAHLFSGLHLLVDAAMGVLEARRGSSSSRGGGNFPPLRD
jgi:hypothetical protein